MLIKHRSDLSRKKQNLVRFAEYTLANAYSPYAHFQVGAALQTPEGKLITGANIENASYGLSICAEQAAVARANTIGYRRFAALAVVANDQIPIPCGACRQVLAEFCPDLRLEVLLAENKKRTVLITSLDDLFPVPFTLSDNWSQNI